MLRANNEIRLYALLANKTKNSTFLDGAKQSVTFMVNGFGINQERNGMSYIDFVNTSTCNERHHDSSQEGFSAADAGIFLEGLAYLPGNMTIGSITVDDL